MEACPACRALHDEEAGLGEALRAAARAEELEFPSMVKARVWDAVRREQPSWRSRLLAGWGPRLALPLAAAVALVAYLGGPIVRHGAVGTPGVAAAYYLDEHNAEVQTNPLGPGIAPAAYAPRAGSGPGLRRHLHRYRRRRHARRRRRCAPLTAARWR